MKSLLITIPATLIFVILMWYIGKFVADTMSDYEVITPVPGVQCIAISRMFNTSTDCWYEIKQ